jgi:hypothetical protein
MWNMQIHRVFNSIEVRRFGEYFFKVKYLVACGSWSTRVTSLNKVRGICIYISDDFNCGRRYCEFVYKFQIIQRLEYIYDDKLCLRK